MVSFLFGLAIPKAPEIDSAEWPSYTQDPTVLNYWRFMFGFPLVITLIQVILMVTVFRYDTPKFLKQNKKYGPLNELMGKIYEPSRVQERINAINVDEGSSGTSNPTYKETCCHPRYMYATIVGCTLSAL